MVYVSGRRLPDGEWQSDRSPQIISGKAVPLTVCPHQWRCEFHAVHRNRFLSSQLPSFPTGAVPRPHSYSATFRNMVCTLPCTDNSFFRLFVFIRFSPTEALDCI